MAMVPEREPVTEAIEALQARLPSRGFVSDVKIWAYVERLQYVEPEREYLDGFARREARAIEDLDRLAGFNSQEFGSTPGSSPLALRTRKQLLSPEALASERHQAMAYAAYHSVSTWGPWAAISAHGGEAFGDERTRSLQGDKKVTWALSGRIRMLIARGLPHHTFGPIVFSANADVGVRSGGTRGLLSTHSLADLVMVFAWDPVYVRIRQPFLCDEWMVAVDRLMADGDPLGEPLAVISHRARAGEPMRLAESLAVLVAASSSPG